MGELPVSRARGRDLSEGGWRGGYYRCRKLSTVSVNAEGEVTGQW